MKIYLRNQEQNLPTFLTRFRPLPLSYDTLREPSRKVSIKIPVPEPVGSLKRCNLDFLFHYRIFPQRILKFFGEWQTENRPMRIGDTIAQQTQFPPMAWGLKLIFGVRIVAVNRSETTAGFTYGTLKGHPESGTNEFIIQLQGDDLLAIIQTKAGPGLLISRLTWPILKAYLDFCDQQALKLMSRNFLESNFPARS